MIHAHFPYLMHHFNPVTNSLMANCSTDFGLGQGQNTCKHQMTIGYLVHSFRSGPGFPRSEWQLHWLKVAMNQWQLLRSPTRSLGCQVFDHFIRLHQDSNSLGSIYSHMPELTNTHIIAGRNAHNKRGSSSSFQDTWTKLQ